MHFLPHVLLAVIWPDLPLQIQPPEKYAEPEIVAEDRAHWAFQKPVRVAPPATKTPNWVRNPIDAFLLAALEAKGLSFGPPADRPTPHTNPENSKDRSAG
jgi:hypothetical protein